MIPLPLWLPNPVITWLSLTDLLPETFVVGDGIRSQLETELGL